MRILQIARRFVAEEWGGTETVITRLTREMLRKGHTTELWTTSALSKPGQQNVSGVPVRRFSYQYPFFGLNAEARLALDKKGGNLLSFSMFRALLSKSDVDLYHLHTGKRLGAEAASAARLRKKPYVITLHGGLFEVPQEEQEEMLSPIQGRIEWGKAFGALWGSRKLVENADAVLCLSQAEAEKVKERLPVKRVEVFPNGVDPSEFENGNGDRFRQSYGYALTDRLVVCIGRIDPQKNQHKLLEAFAKLPRSLHAKLMLAGPVTNSAYLETLKKTAEALDITERFRIFPAFKPSSQELADAYAAANVFVLPSIHEPFGIVILEAWSAGKPVVATEVGGIPYFVQKDWDGLLVPPNEADPMANAMESILVNPDLAQKLGDRGARKVQESYTWDRISNRLLDLYDQVREERG